MKLQDSITIFLENSHSESKLSNKTIFAYAYDLKQFSLFFQDYSLDNINQDDIRRYLNFLENDRKLKDSSIRRKLMTLKAFFNFFYQKQMIFYSPLDKIKFENKEPKPLPKIITTKDVQNLLKYAKVKVDSCSSALQPQSGSREKLFYENSIRNRAIIELLFSTGMKINELINLDVSSVCTMTNTVHIKGKGCRERVVAIKPSGAKEAIKEYLAIRNQQQATDPNALFINRFGGRLSIFAIESLFEKMRKSAGIEERFTPLGLRHTMAANFLKSRKNIQKLKTILGHSTLAATQRYQKIPPKIQRNKAVEDIVPDNPINEDIQLQDQPKKTSRIIRRPKTTG